MKNIYKFGPLDFQFNTEVTGRIVKAGIQNDQVFVWAEQSEGDTTISKVKIVPTGVAYEEEYVDTVFEENGRFVWHVIKEKNND